MKVTSDRIQARARQLRSSGFKLSGKMVRSTLELNAGAGTRQTSRKPDAQDQQAEDQEQQPEKTEAA